MVIDFCIVSVAAGVIKSGVRLLTAQKPILERQGWWKGKVALFWRPATGGERVDSCPKADAPLTVSRQELLKGSFRGV